MAAPGSSAPEGGPYWAAPVQITLLALFVGAAGFVGAVVAPAAFAVRPTRELSGALVGRALPAVFMSGIVASLIALALEVAARRPRRRARLFAVSLVAVACAVAQFGIAPRIGSLRANLPVPLDSLANDDPQRVAFGRLHVISVGCLGVAILGASGGLLLAALSLRPGHQR